MTELSKIRNFSIIAHIDHGKSTLSDRLIEVCGAVEQRQMESQILDNMDLERERGITIKAQSARLLYTARDGQEYILNLIDTPGHVDFSYEVSRSLQAVETAVLVVDATQGIQAQTLANVYLALEQDLTIIPVINKVDLPAADVEGVAAQIINLLGCSREEIIEASGKTGKNVDSNAMEGYKHRLLREYESLMFKQGLEPGAAIDKCFETVDKNAPKEELSLDSLLPDNTESFNIISITEHIIAQNVTDERLEHENAYIQAFQDCVLESDCMRMANAY